MVAMLKLRPKPIYKVLSVIGDPHLCASTVRAITPHLREMKAAKYGRNQTPLTEISVPQLFHGINSNSHYNAL